MAAGIYEEEACLKEQEMEKVQEVLNVCAAMLPHARQAQLSHAS